MFAAISVALLLSMVAGPAAGFRKIRRRTTGSVGTVSQLHTFGSPMVAKSILKNPLTSSGCFPGYRVIREKKGTFTTKVDAVVPVLYAAGFEHPKQQVLKLDSGRSDKVESCGWKQAALSFRFVSIGLHSREDYVRMADAKVGAVATLALENSYNNNTGDVASKAREAGWGLVDTAYAPGTLSWMPGLGADEVSHLFQHPSTLDCMITFEGSDSVGNWLDNINFFTSSFCNLPIRTHTGFQDAMRIITRSRDYQEKIRPRLPSCRSVWAVGHSLGGAIATLFSACANNYANASSSADFRNLTWTKGTPKRMDYK